MTFTVGMPARPRRTTIDGRVGKLRYCQDTGALLGVRIDWAEDGEEHHREFAPDEVEAIPAAAAA